jgi:ketosteroid isomerase-like protein
MATVDISRLVHDYYAAYGSKDRQVVEDLLSDDFTFSSPQDDHIDRTTYFAKRWPNSSRMRTIEVEKLCQQHDEVFVRYRLEMLGGGQFRNVEVLRFRGPKIVEVDVYFGRTLVDAA